MPAHRCSVCAITYPVDIDRCRVCGEPLAHLHSATPDSDWREQVAQLTRTGDQADEEARITRWRLLQLLRLGIEVERAEQLAADRSIDLHALTELIGRGCPLGTAIRILV